MDEITSYKNKLVDFGIKNGSFKNESGQNVDYKQLVAVLSIDGVEEEITLSGQSAPSPKMLALALRGAEEV